MPPNHPPLGQTSAQTTGAPLPEITEAIEKAEKNPKDFEAQMTAGDLYYQIQKLEDAIGFYEKANKLRPTETEPMIKLGNTYFDLEKYPDAEKWYESALQKTPADINVRTDYGLTFFLRKPRDVKRAIKEFQISLKMNPNHEFTLQNLAAAFSETNDTENRQKTLELLRKVNPNNPIIKRADGNDVVSP